MSLSHHMYLTMGKWNFRGLKNLPVLLENGGLCWILVAEKRLGIDEELVTLLGRHSPIPVTYAGGVTVMADLERIKAAGMERVDVTVGSALDIFGGNMAYKDVVSWHARQQSLAV